MYDGEEPKPQDWIEVTGGIEMIGEQGSEYVTLRVKSLRVLDVHGVEYVKIKAWYLVL